MPALARVLVRIDDFLVEGPVGENRVRLTDYRSIAVAFYRKHIDDFRKVTGIKFGKHIQKLIRIAADPPAHAHVLLILD
ncbi:MAG: hypothetical protein II932_04275, partial [Treponema sp.]|nr:hypothetical protein [Treponema sp.]